MSAAFRCAYLGVPVEEAEFELRFPTAFRFGQILREFRPQMSLQDAENYGWEITGENDVGLFDNAWEFLGYALKGVRFEAMIRMLGSTVTRNPEEDTE